MPTTQGTKEVPTCFLIPDFEDPYGRIITTSWHYWEDLVAYDKSKVRLSNKNFACYLLANEYGMKHFRVDY